jgi:dienelactone hydrolase
MMKRLGPFGLLFTVGLFVVIGSLSSRPVQVTAATAVATQPGTGTPGPAQSVKIKASDGLTIIGLFYPSASSGPAAPSALLLHQINGSKAQWQPLIPALLAEGYSVLAVDLRGFGETGGEINWKRAEADVATLLAWLRDQSGVNGDEIAIIGASMGANLALRGCAADTRCRVAVALSPGLDYFGLTTGDAIRKMSKKAPLLVASQIDTASAQGVTKLAEIAPGNVMIRVYDGGKHGVQLFDYDDLIPMIVQWLRSYNRAS